MFESSLIIEHPWIQEKICLFKVNERKKVWSMYKVNNKDTRRRHWYCSGVFIVKFEYNYFIPSSNVSVVDFELVIFLFVSLNRK